MHRKQDSDLIPTDTELERTLRSLRKTKRVEKAAMADERHDQTEEQRTAARRPPITDTMEDFWRSIIQEEYSAFRQPTVDANNFELKPALITKHILKLACSNIVYSAPPQYVPLPEPIH